MDNIHNTGLLQTSSNGREYGEALELISSLSGLDQEEAVLMPLVRLASAPVDHNQSRNSWAAHLPTDHPPSTAIEASFCVLVCICLAAFVPFVLPVETGPGSCINVSFCHSVGVRMPCRGT
jgi:hypothetical protein